MADTKRQLCWVTPFQDSSIAGCCRILSWHGRETGFCNGLYHLYVL